MNELKPGNKLLEFLSLRSKKIIIGVVVVVGVALVVAGTLGVLFGNFGRNVLATVGNERITKNDLKERIYGLGFQDNPNLPKNQQISLINELIDESVYRQIAQRLSITVSENEINTDIKENVPKYSSMTDRQKACVNVGAKARTLKKKVDEAVQSVYKGEYVMVRYDKFHPDMLNGTDAQTATLKSTVKPVAEDLYSKISTNKMTFAEATEFVKTNKTIDMASYPGTYAELGGKFDADSSIVRNTDFMEQLKGLSIGEAKLLTVMVPTEVAGQGTTYKDGSFVIVKLTSIKKGEASNLDTWFTTQKSALKLRTYYEKIN